jgi:hypothetical protein
MRGSATLAIALTVACGGNDAPPGDTIDAPPGPGEIDATPPDAAPPSAFCQPIAPPSGQSFYVAPAPTGSDGNDGSQAAPWATIDHAIDTVPDGSAILVQPGTYNGRVHLDRTFAQGIVVRSEVPYRAKLRAIGTVVSSYYGQGISLEGFDIAHDGPGGALVIQIQDLLDDPGSGEIVSRIAIRNNILHDSFDNDILKINNGAAMITVEGNVFYNQSGSDEHIDINSVTDVVVRGNVFFNDFAGSGRVNNNDTSSYIVIKDSNGTGDAVLGSRRITVERNVFLHWEGSTGSNFVLIGEDGTANFEADGVLVENNLFLGDSSNTIRAAFGVKGSRDVTFRNNTVSGDLSSLAYAMRLNREGANPQLEAIHFYNNVWADPTATMDDFSDTPPADIASFSLATNLYWNAGTPIPSDAGELVNVDDDATAVLGDPMLPSLAGLIDLPRWDEASGTFGGGGASTCDVLERLATAYGTPAAGSAAIDAADPANAPAYDLLGRPRSAPDIGAIEAD